MDLDKRQKSGLVEVEKILGKIRGLCFHKFTKQDVVRHPLVQKIVEAYEGWDSDQQRLSAEARAERKAYQDALVADNDTKADAQN